MAMFEEVPAHLQTHKTPAAEKEEAEGPAAGAEVPAESIPEKEVLPQIAPEERLLSPAVAGEALGAMTGAGAFGAQKAHALYKLLGDKFGKPSLQTYANTQIGDRYNVPLKDLQRLAGMEHPITTQSMVQDAAARLKGAPEIPARREPILDPQGVHRGWRQIPRTEAVPPVDLSAFEKPTGVKGVVQGTMKQGALPVKAGIAGYDIGSGLENISRGNTGLGALEMASGAAMGASATPWLKGKAKAIATGLGALPIAGRALNAAISPAEAAPMSTGEKALTAADLATSFIPGPAGMALGLMKPTELGSGDVYPGRQGTNPLKGTGSVMEHYVPRKAAGGEVNLKPRSAIGIAPYGMRHDSMTPKGLGYFGEVPNKAGGISTEISAYDPQIGDYPLMAPTMTQQEIAHLVANKEPTDDIYRKAALWAQSRKAQDKSPFAQPGELRIPVNALPKKATGGGIKQVKHTPKDLNMLLESIKASHIVKPQK